MTTGTWQVGDDPEQHPKYAAQVDLELEMRDGLAGTYGGRAGFERRKERAEKRGHMTSFRPYRKAMETWVPSVVDAIGEFIKTCRSYQRAHGGLTPISLMYIDTVDKHKAAFITITTVLDRMANGQASVVSCAQRIGLALMHETMMEAWEKREPALYRQVQKGLTSQGATHLHRRRVNINRFNKLVREKFEWTDWPQEDRLHIGFDLLNCLIMGTAQFSVSDDPEQMARKKNHRRRKVLVLDTTTANALAEGMARKAFLSPIFLPTLIPPKRWDGTTDGGYYTPYVIPPRLIRFHASQESQRARAADEYDALDMPKVQSAINAIQETPWVINQRVYAVAAKLWHEQQRDGRHDTLAGLPGRKPEPIPPKPASAPKGSLDDIGFRRSDEWKAWKQTPSGAQWMRSAAQVWNRNARRTAAILSTARTLTVADRMGKAEFYFPHMLDWRGRMYPIPADLQPQAGDLARGLLTFASGTPVTEKNGGLAWLAIHLANVCGHDKVSFDERILWVQDDVQEQRWVRIATAPLDNRDDWIHEDNPWQVLAAVFEYVAALRAGFGYVSSLPIRVDGTCNGIQHLSALTRDEVGGASVNLVPSDHPQDIYKIVADEALGEVLREYAAKGGVEGGRARWWLDLCDDDIPRSLTKRPVMILPYGGTFSAYMEYTWDWLREFHPEVVATADREIAKNVGFLCKRMMQGISETVSGAVEVMEWLKACAKAAAAGNQPIFWTVPSGFVVRHFYGQVKSILIKKKLDGTSYRFRRNIVTAKLDLDAQLRGISPNFIHSIDGACMVEAMNILADSGVRHLTAIHDAYGTTAGDMWTLHHAAREAFVRVHEVDLLQVFRDQCQELVATHIAYTESISKNKAMARADKALPKMLPRGALDIEAVRNSDYFFA